MPQKYIRKSQLAMQFTNESKWDVLAWVGNSGGQPCMEFFETDEPRLYVEAGGVYVELGDWVVLTQGGQFEVYSDEDFKREFAKAKK